MGGDAPRLLRLAKCANGAAMPHMARASALGFNRLFLSVDDLPEARRLQPGEGPRVCVAHGVHPDVQRQWALGRYQEDPLRRMKRRGELGDRPGRPIVWQNEAGRVVLGGERPALTATEFETMRWAHSYGVRTGVNTEACELSGRAVNVAFYSDLAADQISGFEDAVAILFYLSHQIVHDLRDCLTLQARSTAVRLTPREAECLRWVAVGKNAQETAVIMRLSVQTVRDHLKRVRGKLNATTRAQALMRAAALGLLPAQP